MMNLKTPKLMLRELVATDLENVFKGLSHPEVIKHYGVSYDSLEATQEQMDWYNQPAQNWFAVCRPADGTFFGAGGLNDIDHQAGKAEIGFWLLPEFWGQGLMKEALPLIANY